MLFKHSVTVMMLTALTTGALAANVERPKSREKEGKGAAHAQGSGALANGNARVILEATANKQVTNSKNQRAGETVQEVFLDPSKVENDPIAIQGVNRFVARIAQLEAKERLSPDEARQKALQEINPNLKDEDLIKACGR